MLLYRASDEWAGPPGNPLQEVVQLQCMNLIASQWKSTVVLRYDGDSTSMLQTKEQIQGFVLFLRQIDLQQRLRLPILPYAVR